MSYYSSYDEPDIGKSFGIIGLFFLLCFLILAAHGCNAREFVDDKQARIEIVQKIKNEFGKESNPWFVSRTNTIDIWTEDTERYRIATYYYTYYDSEKNKRLDITFTCQNPLGQKQACARWDGG